MLEKIGQKGKEEKIVLNVEEADQNSLPLAFQKKPRIYLYDLAPTVGNL